MRESLLKGEAHREGQAFGSEMTDILIELPSEAGTGPPSHLLYEAVGRWQGELY